MVAAWSVRRKLLWQPRMQNYNLMLDLTTAWACIQTMNLSFSVKMREIWGQITVAGQMVQCFCSIFNESLIKIMDSKSFSRAAFSTDFLNHNPPPPYYWELPPPPSRPRCNL